MEQIPTADADAPLDDLNQGNDVSMANGVEMESASPEYGDEDATVQKPDEAAEGMDSSKNVANDPGSELAEGAPGRISDEQDFDAVSSRQTIESDASRLKAQREAYLEIRFSELPERDEGSPPSIVEFALSTSHAVGEGIWSRSGAFTEQRYQRNCASFANDDLAQEAFLANGGPRRNWKGLDPDGDGFACGWDPKRFRDSVAAGG